MIIAETPRLIFRQLHRHDGEAMERDALLPGYDHPDHRYALDESSRHSRP